MTDLKIIEEAFPLQGDFAQDAKYTWPSRWEAVKNDLAHVPEGDAIGEVLLCCASGEGSHEFKVCADEAAVMKFLEDMTGAEEDGTMTESLKHYRDEDNWSNGGTAYNVKLYCAEFSVWKIGASELALPSPLAPHFKEPT